MFKNIITIIILLLIVTSKVVTSKDSIIYSDYISKDKNNNIEAKGQVKIIDDDQILTSESIYIDEENNKIILEEEFTFKDESENYYFGSSGEFSQNFENSDMTITFLAPKEHTHTNF